MEVLGGTQSICPVCFKRVYAERVRRGENVFMEKTCDEHGFFSTLIWNGKPDYLLWGENEGTRETAVNNTRPAKDGCPFDCGLCENHITGTCCVLLEVTKRCNLNCPVCYADAGNGADVPLPQIEKWYDTLRRSGVFNIQLSGGEPSLRDDLPRIIEIGRKKGFSFFQLNTNGIRIAEDKDYLISLKKAGLNCVFLQFDSLRDEAYAAIRGRNLLETKLKAVENAGCAGLGVVLVPTVINGVNDCDIGSIIDFAVKNMPVVRGVHFQPVSFFGRYVHGFLKAGRLTLPYMLRLIQRQTGGAMKPEHFSGGGAESAYCSFHGSFIKENGVMIPSSASKPCCCSSPEKSREYVASRWSAASEVKTDGKADSLDEFLLKYDRGTLAVSCMLFQDAWTLDVDRLKKCYIHVVGERGLVPFCAHNIGLTRLKRGLEYEENIPDTPCASEFISD